HLISYFCYIFISRNTVCSSFFFFQAEDGIRDDLVTGVQTCALPIWCRRPCRWPSPCAPRGPRSRPTARAPARSEERRVGKECRSRWSPDHEKKDHLATSLIRALGGAHEYSNSLHVTLPNM